MFNVSILSIWSGCFSPTPRLLLPIDPKCCGSLGSSPRCGVVHCQALEEMQPEEQSFYSSQVGQCDFSDVRARKSIFCVFGAFSLEYPHQLWILLCGFCIFWASRPVYMIFLDNDDHVVYRRYHLSLLHVGKVKHGPLAKPKHTKAIKWQSIII